MWNKFIKIYGGGPSIVREKPYIYSTAIEENPIPASRLRSPSPIGVGSRPRGGPKREDSNLADGVGVRKKFNANA